MVEVILFHHVQGLTDGVRALADELEQAGHVVHTPDFFAGELPPDIPSGMELVQRLGQETVNQRADELVGALPQDLVYAGVSWGVMLAQRFAQRRAGARGALLLESFVDPQAPWSFGPWPSTVPVQIHGMADDPFFAHEGDLDAAQQFVQGPGVGLAQLFTYPGRAHLFTDSSLPGHDPQATALLMQRVGVFLERLAASPDRSTP